MLSLIEISSDKDQPPQHTSQTELLSIVPIKLLVPINSESVSPSYPAPKLSSPTGHRQGTGRHVLVSDSKDDIQVIETSPPAAMEDHRPAFGHETPSRLPSPILSLSSATFEADGDEREDEEDDYIQRSASKKRKHPFVQVRHLAFVLYNVSHPFPELR